MQRSTRVKFLLVLAAITVLVRLPFFFHDVIDPDESTFILMGQDIVDGNLPYDKQWDLKPPLLFYSFAATIAVFGKSIPAIRLAGLLCVLAASSLIFLCAEKLRGPRTGFIAAFLFIVTSTFSEAGAGTVSEIVAVVPLAAAMLVLLKEQVRARDFFLAGFFISLACLVRLNLGYLAPCRRTAPAWRLVCPPARRSFGKGLFLCRGRGHTPCADFFALCDCWKRTPFFHRDDLRSAQLCEFSDVFGGAAHKYTCSAFEPCCLLLGFPVLASLACGVPIYFFPGEEHSGSRQIIHRNDRGFWRGYRCFHTKERPGLRSLHYSASAVCGAPFRFSHRQASRYSMEAARFAAVPHVPDISDPTDRHGLPACVGAGHGR